MEFSWQTSLTQKTISIVDTKLVLHIFYSSFMSRRMVEWRRQKYFLITARQERQSVIVYLNAKAYNNIISTLSKDDSLCLL
jgi:hypothetical protein